MKTRYYNEEIWSLTHPPKAQSLLDEALDVHLRGLEAAKRTYGEESLVVGKYYGNLGRLYQARREFQKVPGSH
jgi:predicted urease superfamily metal-dependent hydrolase